MSGKKFKKIYIEITNKCNLNCSFCSKDNRESREMSLEEFELVLKKIDQFTDYIYLHVKGEPLIHSKFTEILNVCKKYDKKVNITTNGTLLSRKYLDIINSGVVRQINISFQSLLNDKYLIDILNVSQLILERSNIQLVFRFWALDNNEFTLLEIQFINSIINFLNLEKNIMDEIEHKQNIKLLDRLYLNKANVFEWPSLNNAYYNELGHCYGLKTHIGILSDGTVVPCCLDSSGVVNLGNIFNDDLNNILMSKRVESILKWFNDNKACEELCKHCSFKNNLKQ